MSQGEASADGTAADDQRFARYARQMRYAPLGAEGQRRLANSRVLICGCGALGTVAANTLVRAGVGHVRIVDRDFVEQTNLQRQVLFDEDDVRRDLPKAIAAVEKLRRVNSEIEIEPIVADVTAANVLELCAGVDAIVDGTDNFETRFLINDAALSTRTPWVFGGCLGGEGQSMTILPGETPCLRCLMSEPPPPGALPTCDTAGVLGPAVGVLASVQAAEAIKLLSGNAAAARRTLLVFDVWQNQWRQVEVANLRDGQSCPACGQANYEWLAGRRGSQPVVLCGRNAVQLSLDEPLHMSLDSVAESLARIATVTRNPYLLRATIGEYRLTLFPDGRAIVSGTDDPATARTLYARWVGT